MSHRRLRLISEEETLCGVTLPEWERLVETASSQSREHVACVVLALTLARELVVSCVPPSAREGLLAGLTAGWTWVETLARADAQPVTPLLLEQRERSVVSARIRCFQEVSVTERLTLAALRHAARPEVSAPAEFRSNQDLWAALWEHAGHVVDRYAGLAAHFSVSAVCHALDGVGRPSSTLAVFEDCRGARAYQGAGLGAARHPAFLAAALHQATWEAERTGTGASEVGALRRSLAVQVLHEYLGGRYRRHADAEAARQAALIQWALKGQTRSGPG